MAHAIWPFVVAVVGALIYGFGGKASELGKIGFAVGMIWLVFVLMGREVEMFGATAVAVYPLVFALAAALVWAFIKDNEKVRELARITFFAGLLWFVYPLISHTAHFNP